MREAKAVDVALSSMFAKISTLLGKEVFTKYVKDTNMGVKIGVIETGVKDDIYDRSIILRIQVVNWNGRLDPRDQELKYSSKEDVKTIKKRLLQMYYKEIKSVGHTLYYNDMEL